MSRQLHVADEQPPEGCLAQLQKLGLAAYALLIIGIGASGLLCALGSMHAIVENALDPHELIGGLDVEAWRLDEMRRQGLLGPDTVPDVYHDHSSLGDGSSGCMVVGPDLIRFELWKETARVTIEGARVTSYGDDVAPTVTVTLDDATVSCPFDEDEGGDRFARMLTAEAG